MTEQVSSPADEGDEILLLDSEVGPFPGFDVEQFEDWLDTGLKAYAQLGANAFPQIAGSIARTGDLGTALHNAYEQLPPGQQTSLKRAVVNTFVGLKAHRENIPAFKALLEITIAVPVPGILPKLASKFGNGYFGLLDSPDSADLWSLTLLTLSALANFRDESIGCLHRLIQSNNFDTAYSPIALEALCRSNPEGLDKHMEFLREHIARWSAEFKPDAGILHALAQSVLDAVDLAPLVEALPRLKYLDLHTEDAPTDEWLVHALLDGNDAPLACMKLDIEADIQFYRSERSINKVSLAETGAGLGDLVERLHDHRYLREPEGRQAPKMPWESNESWLDILKPSPYLQPQAQPA